MRILLKVILYRFTLFISFFIDNNTSFYIFSQVNRYECPICFSNAFKPTKPNCCIHIFCFNCLKKWSIFSSKCPVCRRSFNKFILI